MLSYDAWQEWTQTEVLPAYGACAARHSKVVHAWDELSAFPGEPK